MSEDFVEIPDYIKHLMESGEGVDEIKIDPKGTGFITASSSRTSGSSIFSTRRSAARAREPM
jgi:hypothetical protein